MSKNIVIGGGVFVALLIAVFFATAGGGGDVDRASAFGDVSIEGASLARLEDPSIDTAIGEPAPVVTGVDLDGRAMTIGVVDRPTIVVFLAHWCSHCQAEVTRLSPWLAENELEGVDLVAVATSSTSEAPNFPPKPWLEREGWEVPTLLDDEDASAGAAYGLTFFPFWVVLRDDGTVAGRFTGEVTLDQFEAIVEQAALLEG